MQWYKGLQPMEPTKEVFFVYLIFVAIYIYCICTFISIFITLHDPSVVPAGVGGQRVPALEQFVANITGKGSEASAQVTLRVTLGCSPVPEPLFAAGAPGPLS